MLLGQCWNGALVFRLIKCRVLNLWMLYTFVKKKNRRISCTQWCDQHGTKMWLGSINKLKQEAKEEIKK